MQANDRDGNRAATPLLTKQIRVDREVRAALERRAGMLGAAEARRVSVNEVLRRLLLEEQGAIGGRARLVSTGAAAAAALVLGGGLVV